MKIDEEKSEQKADVESNNGSRTETNHLLNAESRPEGWD